MNKNIIIPIFIILSLVGIVKISDAQNPILPLNVFVPDVEAHVGADGRMYIYGSWDLKQNGWCSTIQHVFSSADLINWTDHGEVFHSAGNHDDVPWTNGLLYAPDAIYKDGKYFLYFCLSDNTEGVASSTSPFGPFTNAVQFKEISGIDPAIFVDDDGQAYYYWGQFNSKGAKLKPNMTEIDTATIVENLVTEATHHFHEGSSMRKRNGIYYYLYASTLRKGKPTCLEYATSTSPLGPFTYRGVIIDNAGCDPATWNNHGSIQEFKGKWYVFYHRSSQGTQYMRRVCIEPISFNADGTIKEVPMTSQGAGTAFMANTVIEAERACFLNGNTRIKAISDQNEVLTGIRNNDAAAYKYIDFTPDVDSFKVSVFSGAKPVTINITLDNSLTPIGTISIPGNGDGSTSRTFTCKIAKTTGIHAVWLRVKGESDDNIKIDWFSFYKSETCNGFSIQPYIQVNGGTSTQTSNTIINKGDNVTLDPKPATDGTWIWNGPNGFTASTQKITISNIQNMQIGDYIATNTNGCAEKTIQVFSLSLKGITIPATIQAEDYKSMSGIDTESTSDAGGGKNVGWIDNGDWMDYSITIPQTGNYTINYRVASLSGDGKLTLSEDGVALKTTDIPKTGGWQTWTTVSTTVNLTEGTRKIRISATSGLWNFNWWSVEQTVGIADKKNTENLSVIYPNPADSLVNIKIGTHEPTSIRIFDANGKLVYTVSDVKANLSIPIREIGGKGIYFIKVGQETQKLIIQ